LPGQNQRKWILGVHPVVEEEANFLEHLFREKMPFIHNHHQFPVLNAAHNFNLVVQQIPGVTSVKSCFTPQLFKQPIVEIPWRELGFGKIQDGVFLSIQGAFQAAQRGCFASARVANHKSKKLASGRVEKTVVNLLGILVHVEVIHRDASYKRGLLHLKKVFVHTAHPFSISEV
jgi:hypothetical protein